MPLWPHPNLLPRESARGTTFENICFFGDKQNLAPELRDPNWRSQLNELGLDLKIHGADHWHDYREADGVIAVRDFGFSRHLHKPGTKLYNAWLAGVPFLGGRDSAYAGDGCPGENYLRATTPEELLTHIRRLKEDITLRTRLTDAGHVAGKGFTPAATLERWQNLVTRDLPPLAEDWRRRGSLSRRTFYFAQKVRVWRDRTFRQ
jgi:hypothetical protein